MPYLKWILMYFFICFSDTCAKNSYSQPVSYKLGILLLSITVHLHLPNSNGERYIPGNAEPGTALKADTGWVIHIHLAASAPSYYGESTSKALGCFWYLWHFPKMLHLPCTLAHIQVKKKKNQNLKALHNYGYRNQF